MKIFTLFLFVLMLSTPALAFEKLFQAHCKKAGVPKEIALAIAKQESALNPLCINVAGEDFWPATRKEAEDIIRKAQAKDLSYDVGLMQINSQWIKQWKLDPTTLLNPEVNIRYGLRILKEEIMRHGMNWRAVARYHSPNPERGRRYAMMVYNRMKGSPEVRAMLANPRLRGRNPLLYNRKFKNFHFHTTADASLMGKVNSQRKPVGLE